MFKPNTAALAQLATSTSVVIATLLTVPDAIGILPGSTNLVSWMLRLLGIWVSAAVLWFVGFLFILYIVRVIVGGVEVSPKGIKLWRLAKPIYWINVDAVSVEQQKFFSALFRLDKVARRLTIFEPKKGLDGKTRLYPHYLPSFFFSFSEFERLCQSVYANRFGFVPNGIDAFVAEAANLPTLQSTFGRLQWQRVAISILIAAMLTMWLYKKAIAIYAYNAGNIAMSQFNYPEAARLYRWSTETDPAFAGAWNNLGNAEFRQSKTADACSDWEKAIFFKPDFVEPRISLSFVSLTKSDYIKAREYLDSALNRAPLNAYALLNRADLEMALGHVRSAMRDARMVISEESDRNNSLYLTATCLLARGKVLVGEPQEAAQVLSLLPPLRFDGAASSSMRLRLVVSGETALALNQVAEARKYFEHALSMFPDNVEPIVGIASVELLEHNYDAAQKHIRKATSLVPGSAWPRLLQARLDFMRGDKEIAKQELTFTLTAKNLDGASFVEAGNLYLAMHHLDQAAMCAQRALRIDSRDRAAQKLLACVTAEQATK